MSDQIISRARSQGFISDDAITLMSHMPSVRLKSRLASRQGRAPSPTDSSLGLNLKNTDRYAAIKLHREFEQATIGLGPKVSAQQMFDIFVALGYLRSKEQLTSEFVVKENLELFDKMCNYISPTPVESFEIAHARLFFFALNHLWGDWLAPKKLLAKSNRPDKIMNTASPSKLQAMSPVKLEDSLMNESLMIERRVNQRSRSRKSNPENTVEHSKGNESLDISVTREDA